MTEKRFRNNGSLIFDRNKPLNTYDVVDLLNELYEENQELKWSNKMLRVNKKDCELGRREEVKRWEKLYNDRVNFITILQKRLKENGLNPYITEERK